MDLFFFFNKLYPSDRSLNRDRKIKRIFLCTTMTQCISIPGISRWVSRSRSCRKNKWIPLFFPWVISWAITRQQLDVFPTACQTINLLSMYHKIWLTVIKVYILRTVNSVVELRHHCSQDHKHNFSNWLQLEIVLLKNWTTSISLKKTWMETN